MLGQNTAAYTAAGLKQHPQLLELGSNDFDRVITRRTVPNKLVLPEEVPDATPALAWVPDYLQPAVETTVSRALAGSYEAMHWLQLHAGKFAMFANATAKLAAQRQMQQHAPDKHRQQAGLGDT
jgi:hypothetical protein